MDSRLRVPLAVMFVITLLATVSVGGVTGAEAADLGENMTDYRTQETKEGVIDPVLRGLMNADSRETYAQAHQLELTEEGVLVVVDQQTNTSLQVVQITSQTARPEGSGRLVQGWVDVDELTTVAANPSVRVIRPPEQSVSLTDTQRGSLEQAGIVLGAVCVVIGMIAMFGRYAT